MVYLRVFIAVLVGEIVLVLLSSFVQSVLFKGVYWTTSSIPELVVGGALTILAATIAGWVAMWIAQKKNYLPHVILALLVALETTWLIRADKTPDPAWFDALAGLSLIVGLGLGGWLCTKLLGRLSSRYFHVK